MVHIACSAGPLVRKEMAVNSGAAEKHAAVISRMPASGK